MSDPVKPQRPSRAPFDSNFAREESHVRSHGRAAEAQDATTETDAPPSAAARPRERETLRPPRRETISERTNRIEHKMTRATLVLERLPPMDSRARLLGSAILRRDEVLLDAVLAAMTDELLALSSERPSGSKRR